MNLASLSIREVKRLVSIFAGIAVVLTLVVLVFRKEAMAASPVATVLQSMSGVVTVVTLSFALLAVIPWRWKWPARIMSRPVVHGVWHGSIWSNFNVQPESPPRQIEIFLVIQQTYLSLSVVSFTSTQDGESVIEALLRNAKTEAARLCYVFELRRQYKGENKLTSGSGDLKVIQDGTRLKGRYFTDSPTQGEIQLDLLTRDISGIDCYEAAKTLYGSSSRTS